jgi:hypothetical protein
MTPSTTSTLTAPGAGCDMKSPGPKPGAGNSAIQTSSPIETLPRRHSRSRPAGARVS